VLASERRVGEHGGTRHRGVASRSERRCNATSWVLRAERAKDAVLGGGGLRPCSARRSDRGQHA
jgi:hypothetical protein